MKPDTLIKQNDRIYMYGYTCMMHKNYNSCLHILDMHLERGERSVFKKKTNSSFSVAFVTNMVLYILYHSVHG